MKLSEIAKSRKKVEPIPKTDEDHAYEELQRLKEYSTTRRNRVSERLQLFVPRGEMLNAPMRHKIIGNSWMWNDDGTLKPQYAKFHESLELQEDAPILHGRSVSPPGGNKPNGAIWTSSAKEGIVLKDVQTWKSAWTEYAVQSGQQKEWLSDWGYLYSITSNACVLELYDTHDAEEVKDIFRRLGRVKAPEKDDYAFGHSYAVRENFPWPEIVKHFDGVTYQGGYRSGEDTFTYGWDCESTAWLNTDVLKLVGKVLIDKSEEDPDFDFN